MKPILSRLMLALTLIGTTYASHAATYICKVDGEVVFTEKKIGSNCTESHTNGAATFSNEEAEKAMPVLIGTAPRKNGAADAAGRDTALSGQDMGDIKILPSTGGVTNTAEAANPSISVKLRNGKTEKSAQAKAAEMNRKAKIIPSPVLPAPKPKVQLTRKQILQNEIRNEQTALVRAKAQLSGASKKGDQAKINRLSQVVRDREANIKAIQSEMGR